jgi:hypothetical protein
MKIYEYVTGPDEDNTINIATGFSFELTVNYKIVTVKSKTV